ncbi:MAG TPA: hypothetical protein PLI09_18355 [Candidatus Hydrogenedentes bacterium]|nr:hypothetical protein [Candidatus Hydrogenedentota bacterium]
MLKTLTPEQADQVFWDIDETPPPIPDDTAPEVEFCPTFTPPDGIPKTWKGKHFRFAWPYRDERERITRYDVRYDDGNGDKVVIPFKTDGKAEAPPSPRSLYALDVLAKAAPNATVYVVEGPKKAAAMCSLGLAATTSQGGAQSALQSDWKPLGRFRHIVILPDADTPGEQYAADVVKALAALPGARQVFIARLPKLPPKGDVVDFLHKRLESWDGFTPIPTENADALRTELLKTIESVAEPAPMPATAPIIEAPITARAADPAWPNPLAAEAFHGLVGRIVRAIEPHTESDSAALLMGILAAFGNAAGASAHFRAEGDTHPARIFFVQVGETSKGRKGTSWSRVSQLMRLVDPVWESDRVAKGLSSGEGLIFAVRDANETTNEKGEVKGDPGVTDKRLFVIESEFASTLQVMNRAGNILSPLIRNAWDSGRLQTLTRTNPMTATGAHISIVGHITRDELLRTLTATETGNGFANRFLWLCTRRSKCLPDGGNLHDDDLMPLAAEIRDALTFARGVDELHRDGDAGDVWRAIYPELSEGLPGLLGAVTGRAEAQVMRLALIYALLDGSATICRPHLEAGLAVWDYCFQSARFIFGDSLGDPVADCIVTALSNRPQGMTRTDISAMFGRHKTTEQIERALSCLTKHGRIMRKQEQTGGREAERIFLSGTRERSERSEQSPSTPILNSLSSLNSQGEFV